MQHQILFTDGVDIEWQEALPLGNGKMGAQVWFEKQRLFVEINHYDIYYKNVNEPKNFNGKKTYTSLVKQIETYSETERYSKSYNSILYPKEESFEPVYNRSSMPTVGNLSFAVRPDVKLQSMKLIIEEAIIEMIFQTRSKEQSVFILIGNQDELLIEGESLNNIFENLNFLFLPEDRCIFNKEKKEVFFTLEDSAFVKIQGIEDLEKEQIKNILNGEITNDASQILFSFFPNENIREVATIKKNHEEAWKSFWKSSINLPDKTLETLWYFYNYMIKIHSGQESKHNKQACGLHGLWNVKNDSLWGSMWYWDVNIQSAFIGSVTSGHTDLLRFFCESYMQHSKDINLYTREIYGIDGWALDYPHTFYNSIQPWCAQFLYMDYLYTNDKVFAEKSLKVMKSQCDFAIKLFLTEEGTVDIPYDISPEQGPITKNSTITLATLKQLFLMTCTLLRECGYEVSKEYLSFYHKIPEYAINDVRLLDSPLEEGDLWLRHPSLLMPIFPIQEPDWILGGEKEREAINTIQYVAENCEIGMFGSGWIAAAFAQVGLGDDAVYNLYERGIDQWMHTNGLPYEESERFMNLCLITKPPIYLPAMMEPIGQLPSAINEMLLQSTLGSINIFPAIPNGKIFGNVSTSIEENIDRVWESDKWNDCSFDGLLAKGGHQVSATITNSELVLVKIVAGSNQKVTLVTPKKFKINLTLPEQMNLVKGEIYEWRVDQVHAPSVKLEYPLVHESQTHRKIYLGRDRDTEYHKKIDAMIRPFLLGNQYQYPVTVLKFDFGGLFNKKRYGKDFHRQVNLSNPKMLLPTTFHTIGTDNDYSTSKRYGFSEKSAKQSLVTNFLDELRKDCLVGSEVEKFLIDMPQGKYTLLLGVGGAPIETNTVIQIGDITKEFVLQSNEIAYLEYPFIHNSGNFDIQISSNQKCWGLNFMILNKERAIY